MALPFRRAGELARNLRFTTSFVARTLVEDPLWLAIQATRRAPEPLRRPLVRALGNAPAPSAAHALGRMLAGDTACAADEAEQLLTRRDGRGLRVAAEVAVAVGRPELLDHVDAAGPARFRAAWLLGDVEAIGPDAPAGLRAQVSVLRAEPADDAAGSRATGTAPEPHGSGALTVLHHLTNSLPHTQSGYTLRSHAILVAQRAAGLPAVATTRPGYPLTIGSLAARGADVVDGVTYRRLIPGRVASDVARRTAQETDLLTEAAREVRADVLHTTTPSSNGVLARAAARRLGIPWVYEVRGLPEETWVASHGTPAARARAASSRRRELMRAKETELALAADAVVTLSGTMRDELVARGVPAHHITVVPNAVPDALLTAQHPTPEAARATLGLPAGPAIGTVSSLVDYEGLETVVRTVATLRARGHDVTGLLVGDGVSRPSLARLARELDVADHLLLPGRVPPDVALTWLAALDVVLVPRRDHQVTRLVTPLKPVEAMAVGRPVVASALPALVEAVGGAGLHVDADDTEGWADAVGTLLNDAGRRAELVERGRGVAIERTWVRNAETYQGIYRRCLGVTG
ncbi:glycosyltransferase family 4 protein [Promicromonospora iranensis]|uniref:Glycosyltransferase involved in cell wall biosynthesis n=1 Tax=Promicromonospora iranensis TaxID=1105144 RepID=A0ABU2CL57_9MICO|nr:glycosyltransferase family 4 protein [Promicromonospora iranensis]MDR7382051.1 glycosyltransferase involved in cell wall biosynthesis [Promicromonospora iranensis]